MSNVFQFKKEKVGITRHGTITIQSDGTVIAEGFSFHGVDPDTTAELVRSWASAQLRLPMSGKPVVHFHPDKK